MDTAALAALVAELRRMGVTEYRGADGTHLVLGPAQAGPDPKALTAEQLREQVERQDLADEWAHVGGPPSWLTASRRERVQ